MVFLFQQLVIKEYFLLIIPKRLFTFRVGPSTRVSKVVAFTYRIKNSTLLSKFLRLIQCVNIVRSSITKAVTSCKTAQSEESERIPVIM